MSKSPKTKYNCGHRQDAEMARNLDDLAKFEEFEDTILPIMKKALKEGKSGPELFKLVESYAAARAISIGLTSADEGKALAAVQDILNRVHGKSKETININTKYEQMTDEELDRLARSEEEQLEQLSKERH